MDFREAVSQMQHGMPSEGPRQQVSAIPAPKKKSNPTHHLAAAHKAAASGDHASAKKHALEAVNALHKMAARPDPNAAAPAPTPPAASGAPC